MKKPKDIFGKALRTFQEVKNESLELITWTNLTDEEGVSISYFFRSYEEMPKLEKKALSLAKGKVLDIGCGAGSHSLYLQNERGLSVLGLDYSEGAIEVAKKRGVEQVLCQSAWEFNSQQFDTLLLLMNGMGVAKNIELLPSFLEHLKTIMTKKGQILVDSSDLIYLFDEEEKEIWKADLAYYGEVEYGIRFEEQTELFPWMYIDFEKLKEIAKTVNFDCKKIEEGPNFDYLAKLTVKEY